MKGIARNIATGLVIPFRVLTLLYLELGLNIFIGIMVNLDHNFLCQSINSKIDNTLPNLPWRTFFRFSKPSNKEIRFAIRSVVNLAKLFPTMPQVLWTADAAVIAVTTPCLTGAAEAAWRRESAAALPSAVVIPPTTVGLKCAVPTWELSQIINQAHKMPAAVARPVTTQRHTCAVIIRLHPPQEMQTDLPAVALWGTTIIRSSVALIQIKSYRDTSLEGDLPGVVVTPVIIT